MISVAIDGPAGAGKSTLARRLSAELGYIYVDTGAMYRALALYAIRAGIEPGDAEGVEGLLDSIRLDIQHIDGAQHIFLCGEDVSDAVRAENVSMGASEISAHKCVRNFLLSAQRGLAHAHNVIMDGRDIGTVVLPNATVKIYLTASEETRARRRTDELLAKGVKADYKTVLADVQKRDYDDMHRDIAPLRQADDAECADTTSLDFEQSYTMLLEMIRRGV